MSVLSWLEGLQTGGFADSALVRSADRQGARALPTAGFEPPQRHSKQMRNSSKLFPVLTAERPGIRGRL